MARPFNSDWWAEGRTMWEAGVLSRLIARQCGVAESTVEKAAQSMGWARPTGYDGRKRPCPKHPGSPRYEVKGGGCMACRRERTANRTKEFRQQERRKRCEREGRAYRTREQQRLDEARKREERSIRPKRVRGSIGKRCIDLLLAEDPSAASLTHSTLQFRARYRFDPAFRAKQIERMHAKKSRQNGDPFTSDGSLDSRAIRQLFANAKTCLYCGDQMRSQDKTLDHIIPRSKGGWHSVRNAVVCCFSCNSRKHALMPDQWIERVSTERRELVLKHWRRVQGDTNQLWLVA